MMLRALIADCLTITDCHIITTLDPRITLEDSGVEVIQIKNSKDYIRQVRAMSKKVDVSWVVAPESEGILASVINALEAADCRTMNCNVETIRVTGDKLNCSRLMQKSEISTIHNLLYEDLARNINKVVIKPRFGVGGEGLRICNDGKQALDYIGEQESWVIQPYVKGEHRSLSLLCWQGAAKILSCNVQQFSAHPEPRLNKCIVNAFSPSAELIALAQKIGQTFPGLIGYVGVDYIETSDGCVVVEINPRLTTSYIGLARALQQNPAQLCLDVTVKDSLPNHIENTGISTEVTLD